MNTPGLKASVTAWQKAGVHLKYGVSNIRGSEIDANAQTALANNAYGPAHSLANIQDLLTIHGKGLLDEIDAKYATHKTPRKQRAFETEHEFNEDVLDPTVDVNTLKLKTSENERLFALFC